MSDTTATGDSSNTDGNNGGQTSTASDDFKPITSQDDLNRVIADRVSRERSKFADYKDIKAKADRLDELEQANKSEIDKAMDRVTKAEAEAATVPSKVADALRAHLVALHEINAEDAELFLTANDPDLLIKQVQRLTGRESTKKSALHVPGEGKSTTPPGTSDAREAVRGLFGG